MSSIPKESEFNLRLTIRAVLAETDEPDPGVISGLVFAAISRKDQAVALEQSLRHFVRQVITEQRAHTPAPPTPAKARSWKVQAIRANWERMLAQRVYSAGGWKLLRDCTRDDLLFAAAERRENAARSIAVAERYDALADLLASHGVAAVGDLPADAHRVALGAAS